MRHKFFLILGWNLFWATSILAHMIFDEGDSLLINTKNYLAVIAKSSGMLESTRLQNHNFEIATDYPGMSLFFTEFGLQPPDTEREIFSNSELKTFGGTVTYSIYDSPKFARIEFIWDNSYIRTKWDYCFFWNEKYFEVNLEREIKTTAVYANHQQCFMANSDFDNSYLVNYEGDWFHVMDRGNVGPYAKDRSASFQHSMYTAIDRGLSTRFPALGWYQTDYDVTFGVVIPAVSSNQRATIAYHGGGRTPIPRHPGFSECQIDWFGKADSEAILLEKGTHYSMKMFYYLSLGAVDLLDQFNKQLFQQQHYDLRKCEDYSVASWGGRHAYLRQYTWTYPQASTNYINTQELFEHRAISIPRSQNGTIWPQLLNLSVFHQTVDGQKIDLTLLPAYHGDLNVHHAVENRQGTDWYEGEVTWYVENLENRLTYRVYPESDKLTVKGKVTPLSYTHIDRLFIELGFSARVSYVKKLSAFIWDIRAIDTIYGEIGITLYDLKGILAVEKDAFGLYLVFNQTSGDFNPDRTWEFEFKLYPHLEGKVEVATDISPFFTKPDDWYREYYLTLPGLRNFSNWGIRPDNRIAVIDCHYRPALDEFFQMDFYAAPGAYSLYLYTEQLEFAAVSVNGTVLKNSRWEYNRESGVLRLDYNWPGRSELLLRHKADAAVKSSVNEKRICNFELLASYPNPFNEATRFALQMNTRQSVSLTIYNVLGQPVDHIFQGELDPGEHRFIWDAALQYPLTSGIYWLKARTAETTVTQKLVLLR